MNIPNSNLKRIVIIGAGFAGLRFIKTINRKKFQVVILDKNSYHTFQPLLYQVATCGLESEIIIHSIRDLVQGKSNLYFRLSKVHFIDTIRNEIHTNIGNLYYDFLILANGSKTNYFGNQNIKKFTIPMKSIIESIDLRSQILYNIEHALVTSDEIIREKLMTFVVVGGGPTGVELSGSLAEFKKYVLPKDYPSLNVDKMKIYLLQASDKLLDGMSKKSSNIAFNYLMKMGVKIYLNTIVNDYDGEKVYTDKYIIKSYNVVWAAGVTGCLIKGIENKFIEQGRILVDAYNKVIGYDNIFAIGDISIMKYDDKYPKGHPMMAQPALQQASCLSKNLNCFIEGKKMKPFKYLDLGSMAIIGRNKAVCDLPIITITGFIAWVIWIIIHIFNVIGLRNKFIIFINWIFQYFNFNKSIRIILSRYSK